MTHTEILRCDLCGVCIAELYGEVAFTSEHNVEPHRLALLCKKRACNRAEPYNAWLSYPLDWFADYASGQALLAGSTLIAVLGADDWQRWIRVLWAVGATATEADRDHSREVVAMCGRL